MKPFIPTFMEFATKSDSESNKAEKDIKDCCEAVIQHIMRKAPNLVKSEIDGMCQLYLQTKDYAQLGNS